MTPKEKAQKLFEIFWIKVEDISLVEHSQMSKIMAKQCALIAVDEILQSQPRYPSEVDWDDCGATHKYYYEAQREEARRFWQQVRTEIENL